MTPTLADTLIALDQSVPLIVAALGGLALGLTITALVRHLRQRRETTLRDLELGIAVHRRRLPLWAHAVIGTAVGGALGAVALWRWLLLAAAREGLRETAIIPGLVGDSILITVVAGPLVMGAVALRRRWTAQTNLAGAMGTAFLIRTSADRYQPQEEDW